ncbi:class I SAM-dependent methyltransferase [Falsibacillus pallidus]|uniref:Methyltransferase family protein n=1 Tax=Falsibacillus pallidus TaxID=493781 RepID=A0A370G5N2_9BACI|nr:class I SAM-dependent methyltransferase [Falsibacillus pallidus]RDI39122.1 methyltransferase family protein [Falsibacillus pallidus]
MNEQSSTNKKAWEYRAYEFWEKRDGSPQEKAMEIIENPLASLKKHQQFFHMIDGMKIANICGSNGRKAVPLSLLGADVTVFDISEENKRYALELAQCANTNIEYVIGDIYDIDLDRYSHLFDILYLEGGVLHYFNDIERLMNILFSILKSGGRMILSDFHPLKRCIGRDNTIIHGYFDEELHNGDVAYKSFFDAAEHDSFPEVSLRYYTLGEIINSVISAGLTLKQFEEHRVWNGENIPWEFTIIAVK